MTGLRQVQGKGSKVSRSFSTSAATLRGAKQPGNTAEFEAMHDVARRPQFNGLAGELGVTSAGVAIQAKMVVGEAGDRYEQEADRLAPLIVRQINAPGFGEELQDAQPELQEDAPSKQLQALRPTLQLKGESSGGAVSPAIESAIVGARGGGQPLAPGLQEQFGQVMGTDFSEVRVYTDARADVLNCALSSQAFTSQQNLFFRRGAYQPASRVGQELIAHELTHIVQQKNIGDGSEEKQKDVRAEGPCSKVVAQKEGKTTTLRVQRKFGFEYETDVSLGYKLGLTLSPASSKAGFKDHENLFTVMVDHLAAGDKNSIIEVATEPVDEMTTEESEIRDRWTKITKWIRTIADKEPIDKGYPLAAANIKGDGVENYFYGIKGWEGQSGKTVMVQATTGVDYEAIPTFAHLVAQQAREKHPLKSERLDMSIITEYDILTALNDELLYPDESEENYRALAGYLTYVATVLLGPRLFLGGVAKNYVLWLSRMEARDPGFPASKEDRKKLRDLLLQVTGIRTLTRSGEAKTWTHHKNSKTIDELLDILIPLEGSPKSIHGLIGSDIWKRKESERDMIFEDRHVKGTAEKGRFNFDDLVEMAVNYWKMLRYVHRRD